MGCAHANDYIVLTHDLTSARSSPLHIGEKPERLRIRADDVGPEAIRKPSSAALLQMSRWSWKTVRCSGYEPHTRARVPHLQ